MCLSTSLSNLTNYINSMLNAGINLRYLYWVAPISDLLRSSGSSLASVSLFWFPRPRCVVGRGGSDCWSVATDSAPTSPASCGHYAFPLLPPGSPVCICIYVPPKIKCVSLILNLLIYLVHRYVFKLNLLKIT